MHQAGRNAPCPCGSGKKYKHCCASARESVGQHSELDVADLLARAQEHQRAGRLAEGKAVCAEILVATPDQPDATHLMGVLHLMDGQADLGIELIRKAIDKNPHQPVFRNNLVVALRDAGRLEEAAVNCREAIALAPGFAEAHLAHASVLKHMGRLSEAIASCEHALDLKPDLVAAHNLLGTIFQGQHRFDEAIAGYEKALSFRPDNFEAKANLGSALMALGRLDEAIAILQELLAIKPGSARVHYNLGLALMRLGRMEEAASHLRRAIASDPELSIAHFDLAFVLQTGGELDEALECYKRALALEPDNAAYHSNVLYFAQYSPDLSPSQLFAEHVRFAQRFEWPLLAAWRLHANSRDPERRLKIGYVSGDFCNHAVAYFIEPVLACHDKSQVEVFCYYSSRRRDAVTDRLAVLADHWFPCQDSSAEELAERIRADGIDILVDLSGHTAKNRLLTFARKPAPIQATWIGYAGTTGLVSMDYRITDAYMDPPGSTEQYHTEKLIRLPETGAAYRPPEGYPNVNSLPALNGATFTFASFNYLAKLNPRVIALWARLLAAMPQARLMLGNAGEPGVQQRLVEMFGQAGVPAERLWFQPRMPLLDYLALHHQVDLALDPFPYNGGTTTNHSLWMGVPVITLAGENMVSRCGVTLLSRVGLTDFIVGSEEEYLQRALQFAQDLPELNRIRQSLRGRMGEGSSNGAEAVTRHLEGAYRDIWRKWCASAQ